MAKKRESGSFEAVDNPNVRQWHVRMQDRDGFACPLHKGWVVYAITWQRAVEEVKKLNLDNGPDGEFSRWPEFTADVLEFVNQNVAELY